MPNVTLSCPCGRSVDVSEGAAGVRFPCDCGRTIAVPSLGRLREMAGLPAVPVDPIVEVETALATGTLPPPGCVECGRADAERFDLVAVCERRHAAGGPDGDGAGIAEVLLLIVLGWPFLLLRAMLRRPSGEMDEVWHGRESVVSVPIRVCHGCRSQARVRSRFVQRIVGAGRQRRVKRLLGRVPAYDAVLRKYPAATIERRRTPAK